MLYNPLRIGHSYLTHSYLLMDEDPPVCIPCNSLLTTEHILINCVDVYVSFAKISISF